MEPIAPADPRTEIVVPDACTGETLAVLERVDAGGAAEHVRAAAEAQRAWAAEPVAARAARVRRVTEALVADAASLATTLQRAQGLCRFDAIVREVLPCVDAGQWYAERAEETLADDEVSPHLRPHRSGAVAYRPHGVVALFSPWNAALAEPLTIAFEALLAGNAVVWKPSLRAVLPAVRAVEIALREGLPSGLLSVVAGDREAADALIDTGARFAAFVGSRNAARRVAMRCAREGVPHVTTVAGKTTLLACADADLERVARAIVAGRFVHAGQRRDAVERVVAHAALVPSLVARVSELVASLRVGDPAREAVDLGPCLHPSRAAMLRVVVEEAVHGGASLRASARLTHGGGPGSWFAPTLLADVAPHARAAREALHGPVLPVLTAASHADALALANDGAGGPFAYVFTESRERAAALAAGLDASVVLHDDVFAAESAVDAPADATTPGCGGALHGPDGLLRMCRVQHRSGPAIARPARDPGWPPYGPLRDGAAMRGLRTVFGRNALAGRLGDLF